MELKDLEKEIENIKIRNARVELAKKWETCWTRKICICVLTYIVIGFTLSTLSLKYIRKM